MNLCVNVYQLRSSDNVQKNRHIKNFICSKRNFLLQVNVLKKLSKNKIIWDFPNPWK